MTLIFVFLSTCVLLHRGVFGVEEITVFVMKGDCVTLYTVYKKSHQDRIRWYYNDIRLTQITGDLCKICTDEQCDERFRDRLELDSKTGSLTITSIMTADAGLYKLKIFNSPSSEEIFNVTVHDFEKKTVTARERETVTLCTGVVQNPDDLTWYFNDTLIAEINGQPNKICTDVQCKDGTERFRERLKLDNQTGSLTITNTRTTDSGLYQLKINSSRFSIIKSFSVTVFGSHVETQGLPLADIIAVFVGAILLSLAVAAVVGVIYCFCRNHKLKRQNLKTLPVMEGDSVTLNSDVAELQKTEQVCWMFGDENTLIAQIKRDPYT
uniref:Immunoglobulin domain-containing protein n=1 Tax=Cyprinus carpio TaxID=7962 RepID=A0A8C1TA02_CYPCA